MKLKHANYKRLWNILVFCNQWNMISDLNMSHTKIFDFASFSLFGFTLVIKLRNFDFEINWDSLVFFYREDMTSDLNMAHEKMFDFVSFLLFGFTLIIKLRNVDIESRLNMYIYIYIYILFKKMMSDLNMSCQTTCDLI